MYSKSQPRTGHTRGKGPGKNTADENNTRPMHEEQPASDPPSPSHTLSHTHTVRKARPSVAHSRGQALPAPPRHRHHLGLLSVRPSVARARPALSHLLPPLRPPRARAARTPRGAASPPAPPHTARRTSCAASHRRGRLSGGKGRKRYKDTRIDRQLFQSTIMPFLPMPNGLLQRPKALSSERRTTHIL